MGWSTETSRYKSVSSRVPPRSATWLLEQLGDAPRFEPLFGDLAEQFEEGRSRLWYWRQAVGTLAIELGRLSGTHGPSFSAAVCTGCVLISLWHFIRPFVFQPLNLLYMGHPHSTMESIAALTSCLVVVTANGALSFFSVWVITRIHRTYRRALLMVFVTVLTAQCIPGIVRVMVGSSAGTDFAFALRAELMKASLQAVYTLVIGLWVISPLRFAKMEGRTRIVTILVALQVLVDSSLYAGGIMGALPGSRPEWYALDALEVASGSYLALLLWRASVASGTAARPRELFVRKPEPAA